MYNVWKTFIAFFTELRLTKSHGAPYSLTGLLNDCYIKKGFLTVGYVQGLQLIGQQQLLIDHFAVDPRNRVGIKAEDMLRTFAKQVELDLPNVQIIRFELGRNSPHYTVQKLADLREALLIRIQADNVQQNWPNPNCIVVSGDWDKKFW